MGHPQEYADEPTEQFREEIERKARRQSEVGINLGKMKLENG